MSDEEIEKIIDKEFNNITSITDDEINNLSYIETCVYMNLLEKIDNRIQELRG